MIVTEFLQLFCTFGEPKRYHHKSCKNKHLNAICRHILRAYFTRSPSRQPPRPVRRHDLADPLLPRVFHEPQLLLVRREQGFLAGQPGPLAGAVTGHRLGPQLRGVLLDRPGAAQAVAESKVTKRLAEKRRDMMRPV